MSRSARSVPRRASHQSRRSESTEDFESLMESMGTKDEAMAAMQQQMQEMQEQFKKQMQTMQEQMRDLMASSNKGIEVVKVAHEMEKKHAEELQAELEKERKARKAAEEEAAAKSVGGGRVFYQEEFASARKEEYHALLRDQVKIKKDGSNFESWREQFENIVYVSKWDKKLFDVQSRPWDGEEEADAVARSHRVNAYSCLVRAITPDLDYLKSGVKRGDARALYKNILGRFAKKNEEKLREAYNAFSRAELRQKPNWDVYQFAGEIKKVSQKIADLGGQAPNESQQRQALLEGLLPKFDVFLTSLKATISLENHRQMSFDEIVSKLSDYERNTNTKGKTTNNEQSFLSTQERVCKYFASGKCLRGDDCNFIHPQGKQSKNKFSKEKQKVAEQAHAKGDLAENAKSKQRKKTFGAQKGNCFKCGSPDHQIKDCPSRDKSEKEKPAAHVAVEEEWNNMVLEVATVSEINSILSVSTDGPVADSGASRTISPYRELFVPGSIRASALRLKFGDGASMGVSGVGTLVARNPSNNQYTVLYNSILFEDCPRTLIAVPQLDSQLGAKIVFDNGRVDVFKGNKILMSGKKMTDRLYHLNIEMIKGADIPKERVEKILRDEVKKREVNFMAVPDLKSKGTDVVLPALDADSVRYAPENAEELLELHSCLKHVNFRDLRAVLQLPPEKFESCINCPDCALFKGGKALPLKEKTENRARTPLQRLCIDLVKGPALTAKGETGVQICVDQASLRVFVDPLKTKSEAGVVFEKRVNLLQREKQPLKVGFVRSDSESVYMGPDTYFQKFLKSQGIVHEPSAPYRHEQNGVVEIMIKQLLITMMIQMRHGGDVPLSYWFYSLEHASIAIANVPSAALVGWSPQEFWEGRRLKPLKMLLMGVIFCLAYAKIYVRDKYDDRSFACMYLGMSEFHRAYRVQSLKTGRVYFSRDVRFLKDQFPCRKGSVPKSVVNHLNDVELEEDDEDRNWAMLPHINVQKFSLSGGADPVTIKEKNSTETVSQLDEKHDDENSQRAIDSRSLLLEHDLEPIREEEDLEGLDEFDNPQEIPSQIPERVFEEQHARRSNRERQLSAKALENIINEQEGGSAMLISQIFGADPSGLADAKKNVKEYEEHWLPARKKEFQMIKDRENYVVVKKKDIPVGAKIWRPREVFKKKLEPASAQFPNGRIAKYKVRLTIAAYTKKMVKGIDYDQKYAATVKWPTVKLLLAIAAHEDLELWSTDIEAFFLYGDLPEDKPLYMYPPQDFNMVEHGLEEGDILKFVKHIYGAPHAAHAAQEKLTKCLVAEKKFKQTVSDSCLYVCTVPHHRALVAAWVDDMIGCGSVEAKKLVLQTLRKKFNITLIDEPTVYYGIQIERDRKNRWLKLHQTDYLVNLLKNEGMYDSNPCDTPLDVNLKDAEQLKMPNDKRYEATTKLFQEQLGAVMWLLHTIPIDQAVHFLARWSNCAGPEQLKWMKRMHRFLKGIIGHGIVFQAGDNFVLSGCFDSDLAGAASAGTKSCAGVVIKIGENGVLINSSKLIRVVSDSSAQAETYAGVKAVKDVIWMRGTLEEVNLAQSGPTVLRGDNQTMVNQTEVSMNHERSRHYRIAQGFIRSAVEDGIVKIIHDRTDNLEADMNTKILGRVKFQKFFERISGVPQFLKS